MELQLDGASHASTEPTKIRAPKKCKCCGLNGYNRTTCGKIPSHPCTLGVDHYASTELKIRIPSDKTCRGCFKRFNSGAGYMYHVRQGVCKTGQPGVFEANARYQTLEVGTTEPQQQNLLRAQVQSTAAPVATPLLHHGESNGAAKRQKLDGYAWDQTTYSARSGTPLTAGAMTAVVPTFTPPGTSVPEQIGGAALAAVPSVRVAPAAASSAAHAPELHWHYASRTTSSSTSRAFALVGSYISVRWDGDEHWYAGSIDAFDKDNQTHHVCYQDDGTDEWLRLDDVRHRLHPNPVQSYKDGQGEDLRGGADWRRLQYQDTFPTSKSGSKGSSSSSSSNSSGGGGGGSGGGGGGGVETHQNISLLYATPATVPLAVSTAITAATTASTDDEPPAAPPSPTPEDLEQPEVETAAAAVAAAAAAAAAAVGAIPSNAAAVAASLDDNFGHPYQNVICLSTKEFTSYMKNNASVLSQDAAAKIRRFRKSYMEKIRLQNLKSGETAVNIGGSGSVRQAPTNWFNSQNKELEPKEDPPLDVKGGYIPDHDVEVPLVYAETTHGGIAGERASMRIDSIVRPHERQVALLPDVVLARLEETDEVQSDILGFVRIQNNIYSNTIGSPGGSSSHKKEVVENDVCQCTLPADNTEVGCGQDCINRTLQIECDPKSCPCGERCGNQQLKKGQCAAVELISSTISGFGIRAVARLNPGDFVYEYLGEMIDNGEFNRRKHGYHERGDQHFYFMNVDGNEVIDATEKGGLSRFINHSCDPNCEMQKWITGGKTRMAIFVGEKPIEPGEEITFDYKLERFGDVARACLCGSSLCRKVFGKEKSVRGGRLVSGSDM